MDYYAKCGNTQGIDVSNGGGRIISNVIETGLYLIWFTTSYMSSFLLISLA